MLNMTKSSGKCKSKSQDIASYQSEWLLSKRQAISIGKDVEKRETLCTVGGNVNLCSHYGKWYGDFLKKFKKRALPYNPAISLLGIFPEKSQTLT